MKVINIKNNMIYLREYFVLCSREWGSPCDEEHLKIKIDNKIKNLSENNDNKIISALGLVSNNILIGFISLLKTDGEERKELTPWYGTMYVKKEYRGKGYSKLLNNAILSEAKKLGYNKVYLKTDLVNYYEKFGAKYIEKLNNKENLFYIEI